jgi:prevent-host-death family protein
MRYWPVRDAKARFNELLDAALREGPQVVTRRGVETAVVVPYREWLRMQASSGPDLKELLLGPGVRWDPEIIPARRKG